MKLCYICNEKEDIYSWNHPESGKEYFFCGYCLKTIMGVCAECNNIITGLEPSGVNKDGKRICYKCSAIHDMAEDFEEDD